MYDPMNLPAAGIPADPLPDDLPEGDSGEVTDEDVPEPIFDPYAGTVDPAPSPASLEALERGLADANAGRIVSRGLRSDEQGDDDDA